MTKKMKILISSCLTGEKCTYSGKDNYREELKKLLESGRVVAACPEVLGGLAIPREPCEIRGERVVSISGTDCTEAYTRGAEETLKICRREGVELALLKFRSPSCGSGLIYDGSFSHTLVPGYGVTAKLLMQNGIRIYGEQEMDQFLTEAEKMI